MKYEKYITEAISPALSQELIKKHDKMMKEFFDKLWKEAEQQDRQGKSEFADGMRNVLHAYRSLFL